MRTVLAHAAALCAVLVLHILGAHADVPLPNLLVPLHRELRRAPGPLDGGSDGSLNKTQVTSNTRGDPPPRRVLVGSRELRTVELYNFADAGLPPLVAHIGIGDAVLRVLVDTGSTDLAVKMHPASAWRQMNTTNAQCSWPVLAARGHVPCNRIRYSFGLCTCICAMEGVDDGDVCSVRVRYADGTGFEATLVNVLVALPVGNEAAPVVVAAVEAGGNPPFVADGIDGVLGLAPAAVSASGHQSAVAMLEAAGVLPSHGGFALCAPGAAGGVMALGGRYPTSATGWAYAAQTTPGRYTVDIVGMEVGDKSVDSYSFAQASNPEVARDALPIVDSGTNWATLPGSAIDALEAPLGAIVCGGGEDVDPSCLEAVRLLLDSSRYNVCGFLTDDEAARLPDITLLLRSAPALIPAPVRFTLRAHDWAMTPIAGCHGVATPPAGRPRAVQLAILDGGAALGLDKVTLGAYALAPYAVHIDAARRRIGFRRVTEADCAPPSAEADLTAHATTPSSLAEKRVGAIELP